ncbi:N-acetylgalactosamine-6-sulfatase-like [Watersipora subatra]|uniref:N-acetylgalactosamine-6-sulfatase-like n=1 Tax=Watersipora subatra TaxID=2589382 RepID=UPI00355BCF65
MADDMGWNDVGFHNPKVKTPNIDELRLKGITLNQLYMQPVCSASRSALVTGKYPSNNGLQFQVVSRESQTCLPLEHKTIFEHMKEEGYATKYIGKWHLGYCNRSCMPTNRGVDEFRGIYTGSADYFNWTEYTVLQRRVDDEPSAENIGTHLTSTKEMFDVHDFLDAENTETNKRRRYLGLVSAFDDLLGETIKVLKETEMDQNTIIIFSSDNGGASLTRKSPLYDYYANNYPLRNGKFTFMEGGVRVPAVYYDPRLHSRTRGTERDFLMHVTDWFPTFIQLAKPGRKMSSFEIPGIDGVSQLANLGSTYDCPLNRKYNRREEILVALTDATNRFINPPDCTTEDAAYRDGSECTLVSLISEIKEKTEPASSLTKNAITDRLTESATDLAEEAQPATKSISPASEDSKGPFCKGMAIKCVQSTDKGTDNFAKVLERIMLPKALAPAHQLKSSQWRDYKLVYGNQYYLADPSALESEWPKPEESPELPNITGDDCHRIENGSRVVRCLFNVIDDPNETKNIYDDEPAIVSMLIRKIEAARRVSVKAVYHPPLGPTNFTTQQFGPYLIPRDDYCTPSIHFPLEPADPKCYQ